MASRGLTLLELLVMVAILGLLLPMALRSTEAHRHRTAVTETRAFLQHARTEAIRRGNMVAVVWSPDLGNTLLACLDFNRNGACEAEEPLLRTLLLKGSALELRSGFHPGLRYNALGQLNTGARVLVRTGRWATALCLSLAGRIREAPGSGC